MIRIVILVACLLASTSSNSQFILQKKPMIDGELTLNINSLCEVAKNTQHYIELFPQDKYAVHSGGELFSGIDLHRVKKTLTIICQLAENKQTVTLPYLKKHFDFYRWYPDTKRAKEIANNSENKTKKKLLTAIPDDKIFLTKYYTKLLTASDVPTDKFNQALYGLPYDEQELSLEEATLQANKLTRYQYTRQQIIAGELLDKHLAPPLIWLTEEALHDVLLQGTGVVNVNGKRRYFNVHRNNGIAYDYTLGKREQARYWYFAEVPSILGYGKTLADKIAIQPNVTFAGNVKQLGIGKLFLINYANNDKPINQMGILADEGGAFDGNLFQLDWLKGSYYGWNDYYQANKQIPDYANAWMLIAKTK